MTSDRRRDGFEDSDITVSSRGHFCVLGRFGSARGSAFLLEWLHLKTQVAEAMESAAEAMAAATEATAAAGTAEAMAPAPEVSVVSAEGGLTASSVAQPPGIPLAHLNDRSANVAEWKVVVFRPEARMNEYTWEGKARTRDSLLLRT